MPKISELNAVTTLTSDDLIMVVNDPAGSPTTNKITFGNMLANVNIVAKFSNTVNSSGNITSTSIINSNNLFINYRTTPTTNTDVVQSGKLWFDNDYIYVSISNNNIKRAALSNFSWYDRQARRNKFFIIRSQTLW